MLEAFFLPLEPGARFCVLHAPPSSMELAGSIVYVHPFAEEMNKSRRMVASQSRRLAAEGYAVLQVDLYGCGDSTGDFGDADWNAWKRDVETAAAWLLRRYRAPLTLWGLRLGALLAADVAQDQRLGVDRLLLWQPVLEGAHFVSQFLRLRLASEMLTSGAASTPTSHLNESLRRGEAPEIAGYELNPQLVGSVQSCKIIALNPAVREVHWLEVVAENSLVLKPASQRVVDAWGKRGIATKVAQAPGEPFWSSVEILECEAVLEVTTRAMRRTY